MTNNSENFISVLEEINERILPITHKHQESIDEHIKELLETFEEELDGFYEELDNNLPIKAIVPAFCSINDWENWDVKEYESLRYLNYSNENAFQKTYEIQTSIAERTEVFFTDTVSEKFNNDELRNSKTIVIETAEDIDQKCSYSIDEKNKFITYRVNEAWLKGLKGKYGFPENGLEIDGHSSNSNKKLNQINREVTDYGDSDFFEPGYKKKKKCFLNKLKPAIIYHAFYIDNDYSLYYFFSNTVIKKANSKSSDKGLGGVFVLFNKEYLNKNEKLKITSLFQIITNKLSNRIIHHYQLEENLKQTRKAAISQVFARNGSHNIGSHVLSRMINKGQIEEQNKMHEKIREKLIKKFKLINK